MRKICIGCLVMATVSACAGRVPQPTPLLMASDRQLDCGAIKAEAGLNNQKISDLAIERSWKMGQNVAAGIVGFMAWPAWLGLDLQDAAGKEAHALSQRNDYLQALAADRCGRPMQTARRPETPVPANDEPAMSPLASNAEILSTLSFVDR